MIITILGWMVVIVIAILFCWAIYSSICDYFYRLKRKYMRKGVEHFAGMHEGHRYWLNSGDREAFGEFYAYLIERMTNYSLNGQSIRDEVDRINEKFNKQK